MWTLALTVLLKALEIWMDKKKASKEMWEAYLAFVKAVDPHRSQKIYESARKQRERLKKKPG